MWISRATLDLFQGHEPLRRRRRFDQSTNVVPPRTKSRLAKTIAVVSQDQGGVGVTVAAIGFAADGAPPPFGATPPFEVAGEPPEPTPAPGRPAEDGPGDDPDDTGDPPEVVGDPREVEPRAVTVSWATNACSLPSAPRPVATTW